jgi:hypothetical protein
MGGQIFISYRRDDAAWAAGRLFDVLSDHFGSDRIFIDVDSLDAGIDFVEAIRESVGSCDVLIAVIGERWLTSLDKQGRRRVDNSEDFVRLEIATALQRGIRVIPVLVEGVSMPRSDDLPDDLKSLVRRGALELSHNRFKADSERLTGAVERALEAASAESDRRGGEEQRLAEQSERGEKGRAEIERRRRDENNRVETERRKSREKAPLGWIWLIRAWLQTSKGRGTLVTCVCVAILAAALVVMLSRRPYPSPTPVPTATPGPGQRLPIPPPAGIGTLTIPNLQGTTVVEVYSQDSAGDYTWRKGYAGTLSPDVTSLQVPAGIYKLKLAKANCFLENIEVKNGQSRDILLGAISFPSIGRTLEVYSQDSEGDYTWRKGYAGTLSPDVTSLQVPAGTYKLKFANHFRENIEVKPGEETVIK